jgi:hypothetical protein
VFNNNGQPSSTQRLAARHSGEVIPQSLETMQQQQQQQSSPRSTRTQQVPGSKGAQATAAAGPGYTQARELGRVLSAVAEEAANAGLGGDDSSARSLSKVAVAGPAGRSSSIAASSSLARRVSQGGQVARRARIQSKQAETTGRQ